VTQRNMGFVNYVYPMSINWSGKHRVFRDVFLARALDQVARTSLGLRLSHWSLQPATRGVNFVGYRIWATHKLLRRDSVMGAKRKLRTLVGERRERFLASWLGHARHADTHNLLARMEIL